MQSKVSVTSSGPVTASCQEALSAEVRQLDELDYRDVLALLAASPQQGVHLESLIADYGLTSPALRGRFFGFFENGQLTGLALIGHQIMFCAPDAALEQFARAAVASGFRSSLIFGPQRQVALFWQHLSALGREQKLTRDFRWFVCQTPARPVRQFQLIQATPEHLEMVIDAHASMFIEATGTDPRQTDPEGFRRRALERIERGRTWIRVENDQVVFKAEMQSVTPDAIYLEGIWTHPGCRGQGVAKSSVVELTHRRLRKHQIICLVVEPEEAAAQHIYEYAGFRYHEDYQAVYLQPVPEP
ncbi:MAG TPA: GNAT family N-acetyltransferase [Blastocatellia bacterium]|nr:GNAT family N-acetyltransferase [Blastocatellia bacterium]